MKGPLRAVMVLAVLRIASFAQAPATQIDGTEVFENLYPGHFFGKNPETKQRLDDMATISEDVLAGKLKGEANPRGMMGLNLIVTAYGVRINYSENSVK